MKYELTAEQLEEMISTVVTLSLCYDSAMSYAKAFAMQCSWPDEERINNISRNGNDGLHYFVEAGFYDA